MKFRASFSAEGLGGRSLGEGWGGGGAVNPPKQVQGRPLVGLRRPSPLSSENMKL